MSRVGLRRGPLLMVFAALMITTMVGLVKVARHDLGALDVIYWRAIVAVPVAYLFARRRGLAIRAWGILGLRIALGFGAIILFFTAIKGLSLADMSIIAKLSPIWVAVLAPLFLGAGERASWLVWLLLACGLAGSAFIVAPGLQVGGWWGVMALGGSAFSAAAHVCIRALGRTDRPSAVVFWLQLALLGLAVGALLITAGRALPRGSWSLMPVLIGIGVTSTLAQLLMTYAYQADRAAVVAAASYVSPVWAALGDLIFFGALLTAGTLAGGVLVVGAGLVLLLFSGPPRAAAEAAAVAAEEPAGLTEGRRV